ncbi:ATP-binding cassette domain-containing protein [Janibacter limosus]|uniref:ATP-binding cassette domain-containing protein n=1 Tax=Janibacter limosus TaxID=53458 RepID=A0AC61U3I4_9MICO|nr:ATP-binding cassette domain-containing protein [Janibacter limosus]UUZ44528.1 ATP-binding cassette domain-containing protein [Janibacter limosus]
MTEQMTGRLVLHDVSVRYGDVVAVDAATASAAPGEITAVTGHSGAGKTSLLWAIGGMLDDGRSDGSISLGDKTIGDEATSRSAGAVLIPRGSALAEVLTARDNIAIPLVAAGMSGGEASALADRTLASVGLAEHGGHLAEELSGGQRQRVAVARGLALSSLRLESGVRCCSLTSRPRSSTTTPVSSSSACCRTSPAAAGSCCSRPTTRRSPRSPLPRGTRRTAASPRPHDLKEMRTRDARP